MTKLSNLKETVTLLEENDDISNTTVEEFKEIIDVRAEMNAIMPGIFQIIFLKPPRTVLNKPLSGVKWNGEFFKCQKPFHPLKENFLGGTIKRC